MASHSYSFSFPLMPLSYMIILLISLKMTPYVNSDYFSSCANQFSCGSLRNVSFPFWGDGHPEGCGHPGFFLKCDSNMTYITINNIKYLVKEVDPDNHTLKIARVEYLEGLCPSKFQSVISLPDQFQNDLLDHNLFDYVPGYQNLTLFYGCKVVVASNFPGHFDCPVNGLADKYAYPLLGAMGPTSGYCTFSVVVPFPTSTVPDIANWEAVGEALKDGFEVKWIVGIEECDQCQKSGGVCGYMLNQETCYCKGSDSGSRVCADAKAPQGMSKIP